MATYGGLFWDVLLLSEYNEHWEDFYITMNMYYHVKFVLEVM